MSEAKKKAEAGKELTPEQVEAELKKVSLEMAQLQLEDLRTRVDKERARRAEALRQHFASQKALSDYNAQIFAGQKQCKHHKGGKNRAGIANGNDANYSVIHHTYPWGAVAVICTRCCKEWNKPRPELRKSNRVAYDAQMKEYLEAMSFPTDNEPSGTALFTFERIPLSEMASETNPAAV